MVATGFSSFDTMVDKANRLLNEIEQAFGWPKDRRTQSYAALRGVLHALRDRLSVDETAQLGAQLPTLIRGVYYDGWKPAETPVLAHTVLEVLKGHVSEGEWGALKARMPKSLATVLP
jgi:uncharacterized protein (DUF2267 family)